MHWIFPLYKKKAVSNPNNYRGIHLTPVLSKVVERVLDIPLDSFCSNTGAYGMSQFAFQRGLSCADLVITLICSWLLALQEGKRVGVYLSDISGAFDKVDTDFLLAKLEATGLNNDFVEFLRSYLSPRDAKVIVNGYESDLMTLANMIFQGTVLGPKLWNVFFKDVDSVVSACGFIAKKFADNLTIFKFFHRD